MSPRPRIGVVALARSTFDVAYAEAVARRAFVTLEALDAELVGPRELLFDSEAARHAIAALRDQTLDLMLVLQVTFTDAGTTVALAESVAAPLLLWAFPEARSGGRLRLNALCGINLAAHALGRAGRPYDYLYDGAESPAVGAARRRALAGTRTQATSPAVNDAEIDETPVDAIIAKLRAARIGVLGRHPDGFDTCSYDPDELRATLGVTIETHELDQLFASAAEVAAPRVARLRARVEHDLGDLGELEQDPLDKSLRSYAALKDLAGERKLDAMAVRCWPEFFTDYGCAACGAMALLNEERTPCACEADVYGNVTMLILQWLADRPALIADLVDLDPASDSGVLWHCGLAPRSMADPKVAARPAVHSNRQMPLLNEFLLKPGRVTVTRLTQARGRTRLMLAGAEMVEAPMSFSGTSGVIRFDRPAREVLDSIMSEGLEHHYGFVYGEHRPALRALAGRLELPVLEIA